MLIDSHSDWQERGQVIINSKTELSRKKQYEVHTTIQHICYKFIWGKSEP